MGTKTSKESGLNRIMVCEAEVAVNRGNLEVVVKFIQQACDKANAAH